MHPCGSSGGPRPQKALPAHKGSRLIRAGDCPKPAGTSLQGLLRGPELLTAMTAAVGGTVNSALPTHTQSTFRLAGCYQDCICNCSGAVLVLSQLP